MSGIVQQEPHTRIDTFIAKDRIVSMVADCKVPIVTKKNKRLFTNKDSKRPSIVSDFKF